MRAEGGGAPRVVGPEAAAGRCRGGPGPQDPETETGQTIGPGSGAEGRGHRSPWRRESSERSCSGRLRCVELRCRDTGRKQTESFNTTRESRGCRNATKSSKRTEGDRETTAVSQEAGRGTRAQATRSGHARLDGNLSHLMSLRRQSSSRRTGTCGTLSSVTGPALVDPFSPPFSVWGVSFLLSTVGPADAFPSLHPSGPDPTRSDSSLATQSPNQ